MKRTKRIFKILRPVLPVAVLLISIDAAGQIHEPFLPQNYRLQLAEDQYQQEHFRLAAQSAKAYLQQQLLPLADSKMMSEKDEAGYYLTVSRLKLEAKDSEDSAKMYIASTPNPGYKQRAAYALAQYYFYNNRLTSAIPYYEMAGIANLSNKEIANAKFELAYCYFNSRQFDKAEPLFASIKELEGKYYAAGNYYYGLLAYNQSKYGDALTSFGRIEDNPEYRNIVPYYIAEIYYFMGERQKALDKALNLIQQKDKLYYDNELHLLAAQILFEEQRYGDALPYFEHYYNNTDKIRKEDLYEMAYSYYRVNEWENAISKFKQLSNTRDSLGQTAMYLLGDSYLKTDNKKSARSAFVIAADMPFNPAQREAALFLAGKLSYELGYNSDAQTNFYTLLQNYPSSRYRDEAKTILSDLLIKTGNYAEAYESLQDVASRDANFWRVQQKVTYGFAMQQLQAGNINMADTLLSMSLRNSQDLIYANAANFWKGEIAYRQQQYHEAARHTKKFLEDNINPRMVQQLSAGATPQNAYLNMGYALMGTGDYAGAQNYFSKAGQSQRPDEAIAVNALLREADAVFMQEDYKAAATLYDRVIEAGGADADYARFQKATVLGLQGKTQEKINLLQQLINNTPPSKYAEDARYELALAYIEMNKYAQAIQSLMPLTESIDGRKLAPRAWMKIGFAYQQLDNDDKAIDAYKKVVVEYPASEERTAALDALKSLYIERNQPAAYAQLLKENDLPSGSENALDSTYYAAAEAQFAAGKWKTAAEAMGKYLQQYPNGAFTVKAHYYKAESHTQLKEMDKALQHYVAVLDNTWSDFTENSARKAATIAYQNKNYSDAARYYGMLRTSAMSQENLLTAYTGLMRSSYQQNNIEQAAAYADTLLALPQVDDATKEEGKFYRAKALQLAENEDAALPLYKELTDAKRGPLAAEARYRVAEILYNKEQLKEAEQAANNTIKQSGGYDYWIVKSYILLADILTKQKDFFNAKATLQSIVKNTKVEELKTEAQQKLTRVTELEKQQSKLSEE